VKKIFLEITTRCNLSCSFCCQSARPKAFMSPATFAVILEKLTGHTEHLCLHVLGEPLLHPDLDQLLELCGSLGFRVNLSTNGTLLPLRQDVLLSRKALRQVNISLQSFEQQDSAPAFDDYLAGVFAFSQAATAATPLFISLRLWNLSATADEHTCRRNEYILKSLERVYNLPSPLVNALTPGHGITLAPRIFLSMAPQFTWPHASSSELGSRGFCHGLKDHVAILVDGTVVPCCLDAEGDMPLGNILCQTMADILAGPRAQSIRQGFARRQLTESLCRRCSYRLRFRA
jgi:sulfatase maturation enzyme AslB (radical SAM superfamily)